MAGHKKCENLNSILWEDMKKKGTILQLSTYNIHQACVRFLTKHKVQIILHRPTISN